MQRRASRSTVYRASVRPTAAFGYQPAIDFYDELAKAGTEGRSVEQLYADMVTKGWKRPIAGDLTPRLMRIELVSMCRNGFVERLTD